MPVFPRMSHAAAQTRPFKVYLTEHTKLSRLEKNEQHDHNSPLKKKKSILTRSQIFKNLIFIGIKSKI